MTWMVAPGGGWGGNSRFQVTGMIEWRQKSKPKKIPTASNKPKKSLDQNLSPQKSQAEFPSHKNFQRNYTARIRGDHMQELSHAGTITNLQIVLNSQKKSLLKSTHPKKYMPKFFGPKKTRNWTFHTHKNPSIIPVTWNPEYPPPPTPLDGCPLHFRPSEQSGGKFVHNTNKNGHHSLSLILSEDHTWLIFEFFCFEASKPMLVAIVTIIQLIKPEVKIAANQVIFTACSF